MTSGLRTKALRCAHPPRRGLGAFLVPIPAWVCAMLSLLCGCSSLATVQPDGHLARHYFGYVKVIVPSSHSDAGRVSASDVTAVGMRIENGVGVGYFHDRQIVVPLDCRLVVLVRSDQQLRDVVALLQPVEGEKLCAGTYPVQ